ncbi:MAG: HPr family phosphocarrier protein [Clostridia bacterium]|nr:HPr family phosphocarrier protein [Clostridia bacterium]
MCETKIILRDIDSIRSFVRQVIQVDFEVDLVQGRYLIDAKSIMGIFALDTLSPITVVAHTENADEFFEKIEKFTVK